MNENFARQRDAELLHRAQRLRRDYYIREAVRHFLTHCTPLFCDAKELLAPYDYLTNVPEADFQWGTSRTA
jgi:hypothetical protein